MVEVVVRATDQGSFENQRYSYDEVVNVRAEFYRKESDDTYTLVRTQYGSKAREYHFILNPAFTTFANNVEHRVDFIAKDKSGNDSAPATLRFIVNRINTDVVSPQLTIAAPANAEKVSGVITIAGTVSDNIAVNRVVLDIYRYCASCFAFRYKEQVLSVVASGTGDWQYDYDVDQLQSRSYYAIRARAYDSSENISSTLQRFFYVDTIDDVPPVHESISVVNNDLWSGVVDISGVVTEDQDLRGLYLSLQTRKPGETSKILARWFPEWERIGDSFNWRQKIDTTLFADAEYTVVGVAYDVKPTYRTIIRTVAIDNNIPVDTTPPTISISVPVMDAIVSGEITVQGTADDELSGVDRVELTLKNLDTSTTQLFTATGASPWQQLIDTTDLANGPYELQATAFDLAGNSATATTTFSISNVVTDYLFFDNFEDMTTTGWSGTPVVETPGAEGTAAAMQITPGTPTYHFNLGHIVPSRLQFWMKVGSNTLGHFMLGDNLNPLMRAIVRDTGHMDFYGTTVVRCSEYQVGVWHKYELRDIDWLNSTADIYQDDVQCIADFKFTNGRSVPMQRLGLYNYASSGGNITVDEIGIEGSISADTSNPTAEFLNPVADQLIGPSVEAVLQASDDNAVAEVEIYTYKSTGGFVQKVQAVQDPDDPSIWRAQLVFKESVQHNLLATAYDTSGNPTMPRAFIKVQVAMEPKPDLVISEIKLDEHLRPVVTVQNIGLAEVDAAASGILLKILVDDDILEFNIDLTTQADQGYRAVGGSGDIVIPTFICGVHSLVATVDATNQLNELDEVNNQFSWSTN